eukprot:3697052-Amphidinium_carterae.1
MENLKKSARFENSRSTEPSASMNISHWCPWRGWSMIAPGSAAEDTGSTTSASSTPRASRALFAANLA